MLVDYQESQPVYLRRSLSKRLDEVLGGATLAKVHIMDGTVIDLERSWFCINWSLVKQSLVGGGENS